MLSYRLQERKVT